MKKIAEYERHAAECRQLAAEMRNPQQRKQLEDMANVWDRLARERRQGIVEKNHNQVQAHVTAGFMSTRPSLVLSSNSKAVGVTQPTALPCCPSAVFLGGSVGLSNRQ